jgi:hypothetical protein
VLLGGRIGALVALVLARRLGGRSNCRHASLSAPAPGRRSGAHARQRLPASPWTHASSDRGRHPGRKHASTRTDRVDRWKELRDTGHPVPGRHRQPRQASLPGTAPTL